MISTFFRLLSIAYLLWMFVAMGLVIYSVSFRQLVLRDLLVHPVAMACIVAGYFISVANVVEGKK